MVVRVVAPGFELVREAFERCFAELGETGAGFVALQGGRSWRIYGATTLTSPSDRGCAVQQCADSAGGS
jgi:hypothetical protein